MKRLNPAIALPVVVAIALAGLLVQIARRPGPASPVPLDPNSAPPLSERVSLPDIVPPQPMPSAVAAEPAPPAPPPQPVATSAEGRELKLRIMGLKRTASDLRIAVFESPAGFPQPASSSSTLVLPVAADQEETSVSLTVPAKAVVAVAVFQDLDGNGLLSKNAVGIPSEPYGFSNDARGLFGPPTFDAAALREETLEKPQPIRLK